MFNIHRCNCWPQGHCGWAWCNYSTVPQWCNNMGSILRRWSYAEKFTRYTWGLFAVSFCVQWPDPHTGSRDTVETRKMLAKRIVTAELPQLWTTPLRAADTRVVWMDSCSVHNTRRQKNAAIADSDV